ncbi:MAG: VOC family protein [Bryobacterales bacterium]|nr:VOC family protein [Bryobacterales bacterium]
MRALREVVILLAVSAVFGQVGSASDAPGPVVGLRAVIHSVGDLDKTVQFYRDGLGLPPVGAGGKPMTTMPQPSALNEDLSKFTDTHGAKFRNASFKIPGAGFDLELTEFTGTPRKAMIPKMQDPGAVTLVLNVRDVNAALDGVKKNGGSVLSIGGEPTKIGGENSKSQSVFVRDPDGFMLELADTEPPPASNAPASSNVIGGRIGMTIRDTDQILKFYHDVLGLETKPAPSKFATNKTIASLIDAPGAEWRISSATIPGTSVNLELLEFKEVKRKPFELRVPDPGSPAISIHVHDVETTMKAVASGGGTIYTRGGEPVKLGPASGVFVRDPDGLLIELIP